MIKKVKKCLLLIICVLLIGSFSGCSIVDQIERKFGWRNDYFEYLNNDNTEEISIQSTRDLGFKFIVTDPSSIIDMYELLAHSKVSNNKSDLQPDYIFEFHYGDEVKKFYYVVGSSGGNFYNDDIAFSVSKRLDEGLIKNLSFIRKPRDFEYVYYDTILNVLKKAAEELEKSNKGKEYIENLKVGVNISGDIDCLKYVYSSDIKSFLNKANKIFPNVKLVENNSDEFNFVVTVKNRGYDSTNFKTLITVSNKIERTEESYYVIAVNEFKEWNIEVAGPNPDKIPEAW